MVFQGGKLVIELVERGMVVMTVRLTTAADPRESRIIPTH